MLNTTKAANTLHDIHSKSEKNLQGYLFAKLYFQAEDFKTSERYLSGFLEIRDHHAPAHKLMGQIRETNEDIENALLSYKRSLEIDPHQNEVVLKICDLYTSLPVDYTTAQYWADRAEELYPFHETVFKLRERFYFELHDRIDNQVLENLIATELAEQPKNISSTIRLLRLYLDTKRLKEAYDYAIMIESKGLFPWNVEWYYLLKDIFEAYQEKCYLNLDSQFYLQYLTALDHLILLTLAEPHSLPCGDEIKPCSVKDALAVLCKFDRILGSYALKDFKDDWWNYFINHMKGQLYFYMMCLLLKRTKMYQGNHKEVLQYCNILCTICYTFKPVNLFEETWFLQMEKHRKIFEKFFQLGSLRTSVIGHIVTDMSQEDKDIWLQELQQLNINTFCVLRRIYLAVLNSYPMDYSPSFSWKFNYMYRNLEFPSCIALQEYDKAVYTLCPDSLHHLVWFELHRQVSSGPVFSENVSKIFKGLQYSSKDLYNWSYETLCILDLEASLFASVYQAQTNLEKKNAIPNPKIVDFQLSFPPDVADALCSKQQASWWRAAYALHTCSAKEKFREFRLELQHGLEVIRGIGNHSMEIQLIAYLARMFADKAEFLMKDLGSGKNERKLIPQNIAALQSRSLHYWNIVLQTLRTPKEQFFTGFNNTLTKDEIEAMQEDGKLYVAVHFLNSDKLDDAAELLSTLSTPFGSYYLALTLKRLASQEDHFSKTKAALLTRAKKAVLETRDRIKDDKNYSSNQELHALLEDFETELAIDLSMSYFHGFEDIDVADDSSPKLSSLLYNTPSTSRTTLHSTHNRSGVMTVRTKNQPINQEYNEQLELSSERMEAQLKALAFNQNTLMKSLVEQQKSLLETNKSIYEAVKRNTETLKQLKKSIDELRTSETGSKEKDPSKKPNHKDQDDEDSNINKSLGEFKISQANNGDTDTRKTPNHRKSQDDDDSNSYVLFEDRAELFTCVDQEEWKKYGICTVKILHNEVRGQVRFLIRDQVKNAITIKKHYLSSDVKIKPCPFSNQAWSWNAQDFADGELRPALFCSHFGTVELSVAFKAAFDAAICKESKGKKIASPSSTVSQTFTSSSPSLEVQDSHSQKSSLTFLKPSNRELSFTSLDKSQFSMNLKPQVDLWECQSCRLQNKAEERKCALCGTDKSSTSEVFSTKSFQQFIGLNICSPSSPRTQNIALGKVKNPSESTSCIKLLTTALPEKPQILRARRRTKKNSDGSWNNEKEGEMSFKKIENNDNANNNQEKGETFFENSGINYEGIKKEKEILFLKSENNDKQWNVANEGVTFMESANDTDRDVEKGVVFAESEKDDTDMKIQKGGKVVVVESDDTDRGIEKEEEKSFLKSENYDKHKNVKKEERTFFCEIKDDTNKNTDEMVFNVSENYDKHRNIEKEERKAIGESKNGDKDRDIGKQEEMPFVKIDYDNTYRNVIKKDVMAFWESTKNDTDRNVENIEVAFVGSENNDKNRSVENEERMAFEKSKDDTGRSLENEDVALVETENDKHRNAENGKRMGFWESKKDDTHTDRNVEKEAFMGNEYVDTDTNIAKWGEMSVEIENVGNEQRKAFGESKKDETEKDIEVEEGVAFVENDERVNIVKERKMKFGESKKDDIDRNVRNEEEAFMDNEHVDPDTDVAKCWKILFREIENNEKDGKVEKEGEMAFAENEKDDTNKDTEVEADVVLVERENDLHKYVEKEEGIEFLKRKNNGTHTNVENMKDAFMENKHVDADTNVAKWEEMSFVEIYKHMGDEHVDIDTDVAKWGEMSFEEIENNYKDGNVEKEKRMAFGESLKNDTNKNIKVEERVAFVESENDKSKKNDAKRNVENKEEAFMKNDHADTDVTKWEEMSFVEIKYDDKGRNVEKEERMEFWESKKNNAKNVENKEETFNGNEHVKADTVVAKWEELSFVEIEIDDKYIMENEHVDTDVAKLGEMSFVEIENDVEKKEIMAFRRSKKGDTNSTIQVKEQVANGENENNDKHRNVEEEKNGFLESMKDYTDRNIKREEEMSFVKSENNDGNWNAEKEERNVLRGSKENTDRNSEKLEETTFEERENNIQDRNIRKQEEIAFEKMENNGKDTNIKKEGEIMF